MKNITLFIFCLAMLFSSCSLVKNQKSVNFSRVKYNSHVKFAKNDRTVLPKTVESFELEETIVQEVKNEENRENLQAELNEPSSSKESNVVVFPKKKIRNLEVQQILNEVEQLQIKEIKKLSWKLKSKKSHDWWEDDIKDWPWLEICLAIVAILVIAILVTLLVNLIGGIISGLIGLILLIALAYLLYTLWVQ